MRNLVLAALLAAATCLLPAAAGAQTAGPPEAKQPSPADKETARALLDEGDAKTKAGDYQAALDAYKAADAIMGVPTTALEVGRAQMMLGRLLEAKDTLLKVTRYPQQPDEPAAFAAARAEAGALADKLATRIPSIRISLATPAGPLPEGVAARVEIDGVELPAATIKHPRKVDPGTHAIAVSAPGYDPVERKIEVKESTEREIEIVLRPPPAPPAPAPKATAPPQAEPPGGTSPLVWIGFGVGGAGLVAGAITGALSLGKVSDLEEACNGTECPPNRQADIDSMNLLANISNVGFGVGAAGVVVGVVGLFLSPSGQSGNGRQSALGLRPAVGPGSIGVSGTF